jgi:nucleoid-associated protein YgaU
MPIMRKDVKLGLAVGGVLLAVLVVYVLVVPGNSANQPGADVALSDDGSTGTGSTGAGASDTASAAPQGERGTRDTGGDTTADASRHDTTAGSGEPASAGGSAKTDTPVAGNNGHADGANADKPSAESAGGGWNWDALVAGTERVPSLGAATDVPTNDASRSHSTPAAPDLATDITASGVATPPAQTPTEQVAMAQSDVAQNNPSQNGAAVARGSADAAHSNTDAAQLASAKTHVVKAGETYSKISQELFGTSRYYARIEQANPNIDPTRLKPGMTITIPAIDTTAAAPKAATPAAAAQAPTAAEKAIDPKTEYKVQPGDNLHNISLRLYGKADRMEKIYELNKATIGEDMARLKVGQILKLPEAPTQSTIAATR